MSIDKPRQVALVVYPGCSLLEIVGAQCIWDVASRMSSLRTVVVGATTSFIASSTPLRFRPQKTFADVPAPDVLFVVGGGEAAVTATDDPALVDYVRRTASGASLVAATGTGSLILAAAGLLEARQATTHWAFGKHLEELGAQYTREPWVEDDKFITGAGSSAAIDISLLLVERLRSRALARRAQIMAEWDPQPPFGAIDWTLADAASAPVSDRDGAEPRRIALVIYEGLTVLDLVGPLEVVSELSRMRPGFLPTVVAERKQPVTSDSALTFEPNGTLASLPTPDVVIVPGGSTPTLRAMGNPAMRAYIRKAAATAQHTASVCTGALLLASAGLLDGRDATTHWAYRSYLPAFGARYVQQRWVRNDNIVNSAGVSAGIDMALRLVADLTDESTAQQVQLNMHYDPDPPLGGIDYDHLPRILRAVRKLVDFSVPLYGRRPRQMLRSGG